MNRLDNKNLYLLNMNNGCTLMPVIGFVVELDQDHKTEKTER